MTTEILTSPETDNIVVTTQVEDIDQSQEDDNLRHIVRPADNPEIAALADPRSETYVQDMVDIARVRGLLVKALCGKEWVPKHSPEGRDTCDSCIAIAGIIKGGGA